MDILEIMVDVEHADCLDEKKNTRTKPTVKLFSKVVLDKGSKLHLLDNFVE